MGSPERVGTQLIQPFIEPGALQPVPHLSCAGYRMGLAPSECTARRLTWLGNELQTTGDPDSMAVAIAAVRERRSAHT